AHELRATCPVLNDKGIVDIKCGRHPLIDPEKVVPVSVKFGEDYRFTNREHPVKILRSRKEDNITIGREA
ncbi:MAG: hypothetical protein MJ072_06080, partial [Clostridia bacterium]|nr:hypothetical protein [Clostridia bacterium]